MAEIARPAPVVAYADEPLRAAVYRMAETGYTRMPVVQDGKVAGMISLQDMLRARARSLTEERERERVLPHPPAVPDRCSRDGSRALTWRTPERRRFVGRPSGCGGLSARHAG